MSATMMQGNPAIPEAMHTFPPTPKPELDQMLADLQSGKQLWPQFSLNLRIALIDDLMERTLAVAERWVKAACEAKGIQPGTPSEGEEWLAGPMVLMRNLRLTRKTLVDIKEKGTPQLPGKPVTLPNAQVVVPVFPQDLWEKALYTGFTAEVWMQPGVTSSNLADTMAVNYKRKHREGKVALVLGAGNVSSIGPLDALYKLFMEDQVVLLKMNPVNEYLGPFFDEIFVPFAQLNFFRLCYGGATEGAYLCQHEAVEEIHITGSDKTHDAIVYGPGKDGAERKASGRPLLTKRITSELGNVSPVIVVPGPWKAEDFDFQGQNIASMLTNNAGFNCNALRVVIQHASWELKNALTISIEKALANAPQRLAYYPGAVDRYKSFVAQHPNAKQFGQAGEKFVPWTYITDVQPENTGDICFNTESFCGVASETHLPASSVTEYIEKAVNFCNENLWGTLSAAIIVHPESLKDPAVREAVERAIANLRYGSIGVNHWPALSYAFCSTTWGAFPGHTMEDIKSGIGVVHNTFMFDQPQKTVVRGPFRVFPKPAWFVSNKSLHEIGRKLLQFEFRPSIAKLPSIVWSALRG